MKKFTQKDYINICILVILFLIILFSIVGFKYVNGSTVDWDSQHWIIPEYFRNLFYETKDLFPSFAFNIGGGQNIYNLSYYGLSSPIVLFSYLFPSIPMINYIEGIMILVVVASIILMYYWLRNRFDSKYAFIGTLLFLLAAPLIYHTHRHIMFVNYMPFLLMALIGVDRYFEKKRRILLIISAFLIIMTSYYYSVGSLIAIVIYGIYKYIESEEKISFKSFMQTGLKFIGILLVGVMMSGVLTLPTFSALLEGRSNITSSVDVLKLLIPTLNFGEILYNSYTIGVTSVLFLGIVFGICSKKKENNMLSIVFISLIVFPIIIYVLSGFMYVRGKVLIPFLPIAILLITSALDNITVKKDNKFSIIFLIVSIIQIAFYIYNKEYIFALDVSILLLFYIVYKKIGNKNILIFPICLTALLCCLTNNYSDKLVTKEEVSEQYSTYNYSKLTKLVNQDENVYRVGNGLLGLKDLNRVVDIDYYLPSIYSSTANQNYYNFATREIGNEMQGRISTSIYPTKNILFNTFMGMKYIVSDSYVPIGYQNTKDSNIYVNENVFPIGYSTSSIMSKTDYDSLSYPDSAYALISNIVVDKDVDSKFTSKVKEENLEYEISSKTVDITSNDGKYVVNSNNDGNMVLDLKNEYDNKLLFISFDMGYSESCSIGDTSITINGVKNTLSCRSWIYHNKNYNFKYVLSSNDKIDKLNVEFSKGKYEISNIEVYSLDYSYVLNAVQKVDVFKINKELTSGDKIVGDINISENGYFILTIPYDKGINVYLDGKMVSYEKLDNAFIGFEINEGHHDIEVIYVSPYLFEGMVISLIGYMIFLPVIYSDLRRKKKR